MELPFQNTKPAELSIHPQDQPLELHGNGTQQFSQPRNSGTAEAANQNPRSTQQNTLLGLFQKPQSDLPQQMHNVSHQPPVSGLVELSAQPTPHATIGKAGAMRAVDGMLMGPPIPGPIRRDQHGLTTATVSGPLNAPNFETMSRNQKPVELGNGKPHYVPRSVPQGAAQGHGQVPFQGIVPTASPPVPVHTIGSGMVLEAPQPFHPSNLLQRQQQLTPSNVAALSLPPQKAVNMFDRRQQAPADHKSTLMSLFGKAPISTAIPLQQTRRQVSQTGSPVSPIPERRAPVKQYDPRVAPSSVASKSRMNSFAESNGSTKSGNRTPISTMDKNFLLGFLEDVANGEQGK
jgi:mRNA-decapping enzyme subunit 2